MRIISSLFLCFVFCAALGQKSTNNQLGIIHATILQINKQSAINNATVAVFFTNSKVNIATTISDKNGSVVLEKLPFGYLSIRIEATGYTSKTIDSIYLREERYDFELGDILLQDSVNDLKEVIVYAEKPLIENKDGKLIYNVGESALNAGNNASELLKNMPLINNDPNGKILLRGKEPKILIDDKPVDLSAQQLQDLLESMPGGSIEKVELMLNPPPQYATEQGGVINIITKKGKVGRVGKLTNSIGTRGEASTNLYNGYRNKKWNFTNNVGIGYSQFKGKNETFRENYFADSTNYFNTANTFLNKALRPNFRIQADYDRNIHNQFSLSYQYNSNNFTNESNVLYETINAKKQVYKNSNRAITANGANNNHGLNITYTHKGKNIQEVLRIITTANVSNNRNDRDFFQQFLYGNSAIAANDSSQQQLTNSSNTAVSTRVNYDKPTRWKHIQLSLGANVGLNKVHNILATSYLQKPQNNWVPAPLLSNDFVFQQLVVAARFGGSITLPQKWKIIASFQAEHTQLSFNFLQNITNNVANNYINVLPNINVRKELSNASNIAFVYRAAIRRPGIFELNPSIDFSDPYNQRFGNPNLQASIADNFDINYSYNKGKYYINTSLGYNIVKDVFNTIKTLTGNVTEITWQNISNRNEYEMSAWGGYTFSKKFRLNGSVSYAYLQYSAAEKALYRYQDGGTFIFSANYNYVLNSLTTVEGNAKYTNFADPQGRSRTNLQMNIGVQRKLLQKRLIVSLNFIDPFSRQQQFIFTNGRNFFVESRNTTNTKNIRATIAYQLNKIVQNKAVQKKPKVGK